LAVILVRAAVLLAFCEQLPVVRGGVCTTVLGESSSSAESLCLAHLVDRGGAGICGMAAGLSTSS